VSSEPEKRRLRDRVRDAVRAYWMGPIFTSSTSQQLAQFFGTSPVSSGVTVNPATAFQVSAFFCAVVTISWDVASLPLFLFRTLPDGGKRRFESHPLNDLLHDRPNPEMTSFSFRASLLIHALSTGNGYAEIVRDGANRPAQLIPITPDRVTPCRMSDGTLQYRVINPGAGDAYIQAQDMIHLRGPSPDGIVGLDVVQVAREALGLAIATEKFGASFFGNGASFGGVISVPTPRPNDAAVENDRRALNAQHQGVERAHRLLMLYNGAKYEQGGGVNPRDSQYAELRIAQVREIARFFRIPVSFLGDLERSTYSNHEQQVLSYYSTCLRPWLTNFESELSAKLIAPSERRIQHVEHVVEGFLRGDVEKRASFYATMLNAGAMTVNEVRERENLPPIAGGDVAYKPLNTAPVDGSAPPPAQITAA